jgi:V/A-type H+/Na+-transporting ATPase subunit G/H
MKNVLKQLLDAELKAQDVVNNAKKERDKLINEAREEVKRAEQRFQMRIPDIHSSFTDKAKERAQAHINELERRYHERRDLLIKTAEQHQNQAVELVMALLLDAGDN